MDSTTTASSHSTATSSHEVTPVVVVPIYRPELNIYERISLHRTFLALGGHLLSLLVPRSRQQAIQLILQELLPPGTSFQWHVVDDSHLDSHHSYNQLMLEPGFYRHYESHSHLLICQLDAYVFEDQLLLWCRQPYDFIGAPLYLANAPYGHDHALCIGVGGFSLRRVQPILRLLEANPIIFRAREFIEHIQPFNIKARALFLSRFLRCQLNDGCHLAAQNNQLSRWMGVNEDTVFSKYLPRYCSSFRLPSYETAVAFCIDKYVEHELASLAGVLPFAAHAWWTSARNLAAWSPFIPELGSALACEKVINS